MSLVRSLRVSDTVLSLSSWSRYLCIGYTSIQLADTDAFEWKRTVADDTNDDENLEVLLLCVRVWEGVGNVEGFSRYFTLRCTRRPFTF